MKKIIFATLFLIFSCVSSVEITAADREEIAIFAGGCFWCMEKPFDNIKGVISTTSGYTGGHVRSPTYEQVSSGQTGHMESVQVVYDPTQVDYKTLLQVFWHNIDPLDKGGQFCDRGEQYQSAIFYLNDEQQHLAEQSKQEVSALLKQPIATKIVTATVFYPAEGYHQNYYLKNPYQYAIYRSGCGRDARLEQIWGKKK